MDVRQIIDRAVFDTHTNPSDYPDSQAILWVNFRYWDLVDRIVNEVKEREFWDIWTTDTASWQNEYSFTKLWIAPDDLDIKKIDWLYVRYKSTDTYMQKLQYRDESSLTKDKEWYKDNVSTQDAFFYIADNSYFIYPKPTESVMWWIRLEVIHAPADLELVTIESNIELEKQFHYIISLWLEIDIYKSQGKLNELNIAEQKYEKESDKMISKMKDRYDEPIDFIMPSLAIYE